jgi:hypothetical protein
VGGEAATEDRILLVVDVALGQGVDDRAVRLGRVASDLDSRGPRRRPRGERLLVLRIDTALEENLVLGIDPGASQALLQQRVDRERGKVAFIEADGIAQRDRARLIGLRADAVEERFGALPQGHIAADSGLSIEPRGSDHHPNIRLQGKC